MPTVPGTTQRHAAACWHGVQNGGWLGDAYGRVDRALAIHLNDAIATFFLGDAQPRPGALNQVAGVIASDPRRHAERGCQPSVSGRGLSDLAPHERLPELVGQRDGGADVGAGLDDSKLIDCALCYERAGAHMGPQQQTDGTHCLGTRRRTEPLNKVGEIVKAA